MPGTYNFSAFNTLYNALYVAGGITEKATLRDIKLFRNNKLISSVDVYKFLTDGDGSSNVRLENNDLILVNSYSNRISIDGAVKSPGKFEMIEEETLLDLLNYAGGLSENAFKKSIKLTRIIDGQLKVVDINSDQFDFFKPMDGDKYMIDKIVEKYNNRVMINGAVFRPGTFALNKGMKISQLIKKASGLKSDAYLSNAFITRTNEDYSTNNISFNLKALLNDEIDDISLFKEDVLTIISKNDLNKDEYIKISGEVNNPGTYPFSNNLSLSDIIILSN